MDKKPPQIIYLQWYDENDEPSEEVTWCEGRINDNDIEYWLVKDGDKIKED